ncbi:MAG: DUF4232 domain-containing protein [Acidimicrobiales bacterium]
MMRRRGLTALVAGAGSLGILLSACSGGSSDSTTTAPPTTKAPAKVTTSACTASEVSAAVNWTKFGGSSSTLAGGIVFTDTGSDPCALRGVPRVQVLALDGSSIPTYQAGGPAAIASTVVTPAASAGGGTTAVASVTFSSWTCTVGSFSMTVRFPSWSSTIPVPAATSTGPACTTTQEPDQTIYIGPVTSASH